MANITFRSDEATDRALAQLTADGSERSEAIRRAVIAAAIEQRHEHLREQSLKLMADPEYRAEIAAVRADMEELRAW